MRQAGPATVETSSRTQSSLREFFSRRPVQLFGAILVVAAFVYSYRLGADALFGAESFAAWSAAKPDIGAIARTPILEEPGKFLFYYGTLHLLFAHFRSERSLAALHVGDPFADDAGVDIRAWPRNVRREHCSRCGCHMGLQSTGYSVRTHGANVRDADCAGARATPDAMARCATSECESRGLMRRHRRSAAVHSHGRCSVCRRGARDAGT